MVLITVAGLQQTELSLVVFGIRSLPLPHADFGPSRALSIRYAMVLEILARYVSLSTSPWPIYLCHIANLARYFGPTWPLIVD
jgi:hypothetical protein